MYGNNGPQDGYYGGSGDRAAWGDQGYGSSSTEYYRAYSAPAYDAGYRSASPPPAPVDGYGYGAQGYGYSGGYSERVIGRPGEPGFGSPVRGGYDVQVNQRYGGGYGGGGYGAGYGGYAGGYGRAGDAGYNYQAGSGQVQRWNGEAGLGGSFGFLRYADTSSRNSGPPVVNEVRWNDDTILSLNHYHHGDHHHHHHQRQVHHFHDVHLMGSADETLDLRNTPDVQTNVIGTDAPPQLRLRPDDVGRNAFCDLQKQISTGPGSPSFGPYPAQQPPLPTAEPYSPRFDPAPRPAPNNSYWSSPRGRTFSL